MYDLQPVRVRVDSTTASGHWTVTEEGLFQLGHSKDHRPDLPQVKVNLSALDPLGMPVATQVVSGESADDPLYVRAIEQVRKSLDLTGLLYVGDSKMAAEAARAYVQAQGTITCVRCRKSSCRRQRWLNIWRQSGRKQSCRRRLCVKMPRVSARKLPSALSAP